ncbi:hypothetical protein ANO11243_029100 [Dothideomycetidae sp. 11243]|nr:hypothetical protein ANO11243_029100 [fungal sp. No.11243]
MLYSTRPTALELTYSGPGLSNLRDGTAAQVAPWYAPTASDIDNLSTIMNATGVFGMTFTSSSVQYSDNWCNMPHVRADKYPLVDPSYQLRFVEVIHRHHKRTPYADNTFPVEHDAWDCSDERLFYSADRTPFDDQNGSAHTYWAIDSAATNPFQAPGFPGNCQFPQITAGGLSDSRQHGRDLASVYIDLIHFLPELYDPTLVSFRVTTNQITSQVASEVIPGLYPALSGSAVPLLVQPPAIDSLEPTYPCPAATQAYNTLTTSQPWLTHLNLSHSLFAALDDISGITPALKEWHTSWDHYFDNLAARLCHAKPFPCNGTCVTQSQADTVFRLGMWEYSYLYRAAGPATLAAATSSYGVWAAELAARFRGVSTGQVGVRYVHNVAHDGSIARLLALLQVGRMIWPGMGAEVVFELYEHAGQGWFVRVLWGGQTLISNVPEFERMDLVPLKVLLGYFDGLVGAGADKVKGLCNAG